MIGLDPPALIAPAIDPAQAAPLIAPVPASEDPIGAALHCFRDALIRTDCERAAMRALFEWLPDFVAAGGQGRVSRKTQRRVKARFAALLDQTP